MDQNYVKSDGGVLVPSAAKGLVAVKGVYDGIIRRKNGAIEMFREENLVVNEGLNALLDIMFHGSTQVGTWYLGLFEGNYTPLATDTASGFASAATETTAYTATTRPAYVEAAAAAQQTTNSANRASFVFNATKTLYGAFLISDNTKNGALGTLFSAARFTSQKVVDSGDELLLTYTFTASSV